MQTAIISDACVDWDEMTKNWATESLLQRSHFSFSTLLTPFSFLFSYQLTFDKGTDLNQKEPFLPDFLFFFFLLINKFPENYPTPYHSARRTDKRKLTSYQTDPTLLIFSSNFYSLINSEQSH